jgi:phage terminase large subunit-like protein
VEQRGQGLTDAERRVVIDNEWEDTDAAERFLPSIAWWDACREDVPPLDRNTPIVLALDAGVVNDCFALVATSRHPQRPKDAVMVRLLRLWEPKGKPLDFDAIEAEIVATILDGRYNVKQIAYDKFQLHQMMGRLAKRVWCREFSQQQDRLVADKQLLDLIQTRRIAHDGNADLRRHVDNADRKSEGDNKLRIVKRADNLKVDLVVALSMATGETLRLNL